LKPSPTSACTGRGLSRGSHILLPLRRAAAPSAVWAHTIGCTTAPRSRSLHQDGSWVLPEGCSGYPAPRSRSLHQDGSWVLPEGCSGHPAPCSRSLHQDGSWVLPEGCSGHPAERACLVWGGKMGCFFLPCTPAALRVSKAPAPCPPLHRTKDVDAAPGSALEIGDLGCICATEVKRILPCCKGVPTPAWSGSWGWHWNHRQE